MDGLQVVLACRFNFNIDRNVQCNHLKVLSKLEISGTKEEDELLLFRGLVGTKCCRDAWPVLLRLLCAVDSSQSNGSEAGKAFSRGIKVGITMVGLERQRGCGVWLED